MMLRKKRSAPKAVPVEYKDIPFTKEHHDKLSSDDIDVGDDKRGTKIYRIKPCAEKLRNDKKIDAIQYAALDKYRHHWYHGGLQSNLKSPDLNRVFASDAGGMSGLAKNDHEAHHRKQYHVARELLKPHHRVLIVVDNVIIQELPLHVCGIGWDTPSQGRAAAIELLRVGADILAHHWGIG